MSTPSLMPDIDGSSGTPAAPSPAAPAPTPGIWQRVVTGALEGLKSGGVGGAILGAATDASPTIYARQQKNIQRGQDLADTGLQHAQAQVKFQDAQTASMITDSAMKQRQIDQMPEELKIKQQEAALPMANFYTSQYGPPSQITKYDPNDPNDTAAHASLAQSAATNGGVVPPTITLHVGDNLLHWNANDMATNPSNFKAMNDAAHVLGRPAMSMADYNRLKPADRISQMSSLMSLIEPDTTVEPSKVNSALVGAQQALAAAPKDANPALVGMLQQRVKFLQATHDSNQKDAVQIAAQKAQAVGAATQPIADLKAAKPALIKNAEDFNTALSQGRQTLNSIKAGVDGNALVANMVPTMEVLGINEAGGIKRISPAEAAAAAHSPDLKTRFEGFANLAMAGKLTPELASQGKQLMNIVLDSAHQKAVQNAQAIGTVHGLDPSQTYVPDRSGKPATLDKVKGSPMYGVSKSTGKRFVSYDGGKTTQPAE